MSGLYLPIQEEIMAIDTVLDFGCGIMTQSKDLNCKTMVGVDIWGQYLDALKNKFTVLKVNLSKEQLDIFVDNSFDVVLLLDIVEHFDKSIAINLIKQAERIARKKVIIYTPSGFLKQEKSPNSTWGANNPYQKHRCGFKAEELESMGYEVICLTDQYFNFGKIETLFAVKE